MVSLNPPNSFRRGGLLFWGALLLLLAACWWLSRCLLTGRVVLTDHTDCQVRFYRWYSGDCLLTFRRHGVTVGTTTLGRGPFTHPWAVFPGPGGRSVVCFSWLDTTFAAFAVDLSRPANGIPDCLQEAVSASDFPVRACTRDEVDFVASLIRKADPSCWASHLGADHLPAGQERARCLDFLQLATTPDLWRDAARHASPPYLLPQAASRFAPQ